MTGFIDIHCHILPGIDDGPDTIDSALMMLQIARKDGISDIIATPHIMDGVYNNKRDNIKKGLLKLKEEIGILPVSIGAEIRLGRDTLQRVLNGDFPTLNEGKYVLLELPFYSLPPLKELEGIIEYFLKGGIIPIIAHPEKNIMILNDLKIMERLLRRGVLFQITASSIISSSAKIQKIVLKMISKGYVHVVASDAHDPVYRPPILSEAYARIKEIFNEKEARRLFIENPNRIIQSKDIE